MAGTYGVLGLLKDRGRLRPAVGPRRAGRACRALPVEPEVAPEVEPEVVGEIEGVIFLTPDGDGYVLYAGTGLGPGRS